MAKQPEQQQPEDSRTISNKKYLDLAMDVFATLVRNRQSNTWMTGPQIGELVVIHRRIVADMVRSFQKAGFAIINSGRGYKWAANEQEYVEHCDREDKRFKRGLANLGEMKRKHHQADELTLFDQPWSELWEKKSTENSDSSSTTTSASNGAGSSSS